jgi:hypothetical protein
MTVPCATTRAATRSRSAILPRCTRGEPFAVAKTYHVRVEEFGNNGPPFYVLEASLPPARRRHPPVSEESSATTATSIAATAGDVRPEWATSTGDRPTTRKRRRTRFAG